MPCPFYNDQEARRKHIVSFIAAILVVLPLGLTFSCGLLVRVGSRVCPIIYPITMERQLISDQLPKVFQNTALRSLRHFTRPQRSGSRARRVSRISLGLRWRSVHGPWHRSHSLAHSPPLRQALCALSQDNSIRTRQ